MNDLSVTLNDRLAQASKKFTKACDQIKVLKQQLAVNTALFTDYNDLLESPSAHTDRQDFHCDLDDDEFNYQLSREMLRQKIETLQNFKTIFFMYAHQKAEEITKIQCELYGEDAVREAYSEANPTAQQDSHPLDSSNEAEQINDSNTDDTFEFQHEDDNNAWTQDTYWAQHLEPQQAGDSQESQLNYQTSQLQLIEYDFLTA